MNLVRLSIVVTLVVPLFSFLVPGTCPEENETEKVNITMMPKEDIGPLIFFLETRVTIPNPSSQTDAGSGIYARELGPLPKQDLCGQFPGKHLYRC